MESLRELTGTEMEAVSGGATASVIVAAAAAADGTGAAAAVAVVAAGIGTVAVAAETNPSAALFSSVVEVSFNINGA